MAQKVILTPRMRLILVESKELGSPDIEAMHKIRSDKEATSWSFIGQSKSIEDTQLITSTLLPALSGETSVGNSSDRDAETDAEHGKSFRAAWIAYARLDCHNAATASNKNDIIISTTMKDEGNGRRDRDQTRNIKSYPDDHKDNEDQEKLSPDAVLGVISIKEPQYYGASLPPSLIPPAKPELLRMELGYCFLPQWWGKGYAVEASKAALESYQNSFTWWGRQIEASSPIKTKLWISAVIRPSHSRSLRVAEKAGLEYMGVHAWDGERMYIGGDWQDPKVLVYGKMLA